MKGNLFIISSPSGGGKGTLIREVIKTVPNVGYSVSFTSREMRGGEENGKDYFFVEESEFERKIESGDFLEFARVHGNYYGTSKAQVEKEFVKGNDVILEIDVQGAEIVRRNVLNAVGIFILPPSFVVLKNRLAARNTETNETLRVRLDNARDEVKEVDHFEYAVINEDVERSSLELAAIFLAERQKRVRQTERIRDILNTFGAEKV